MSNFTDFIEDSPTTEAHVVNGVKHREINDSGFGDIDLWSAQQIESYVTTGSGTSYYIKSEVDTISGSLSTEIDSDVSTHSMNGDAHHAESHSVASHSDTVATGAELNELTGAGETLLHIHDGRYYTESEVDSLITTISGKLDDHNELNNLDYASSGHTGFQLAGDYLTESEVDTISGALSAEIDSDISIHSANTTFVHGIADTSDLVLKSGNVNQFSDITSAGADIEDAVTERHASTLIGTKTIDEADIGNSKVIAYNSTSGNLEYEDVGTPSAHKDSHDPQDGGDALDTANAAEIAGVQVAGTGLSHSFARADHVHQIQHGIIDNHLATYDGVQNSGEICRMTADGIESRTDAEMKTQLGYLADVVDDTSPQLGGDFEYNEKNQVFNAVLTSDNTVSGDIIIVTFGEAVAFGQLCYPDATDNEWKLALGTNVTVKHPAMGVALESKTDGQTGKLLLRGLIRDATYFSGFELGDILYLSDTASGSWLNAAPSDTGDIVQIVGWALAANYAFFNPDYTYIERS